MSLKEEFLRLLRDDVEFRLAVGGLLGYSEITGRLSKTEEVVQEILKEIRLSRNDFNRLAEEQRNLAEEQKKLREEIVQLRSDFNRLAEEQMKLAEEIVRLRNDYKRLGDRFEVILGRMGRRWGA
jgi:chromosome segregation ATPase